TPVGTESLSDDDSDPFAFSEKSGNSHQPSESQEFNVSYHKVNPGTSTYVPNMTHVAKLNDVSGYTCVFDEATSLKEMGNDVCSPVVDDVVISMGNETMSHASYDSDQRSGKACVDSMSNINSIFASVSDANLRTEPSQKFQLPPPSRLPSVLTDSNEEFHEMNSSPMASERCGLEANVNYNLPPSFDMEVNASTSAAASAAAMKDAMEKAQAKLKAARESRDRKDRVQNSGKLQLKTDVNGGGNVQGVRDENLAEETKVHATSDRGLGKIKNSAKTRHDKTASHSLPDNLVVEQPTAGSVKPAETKQGKKSSLSMDTDVAGQWKEARQYYEFVNSDNTRLVTQPPSSNGDAQIGTKRQDNDNHDSDSAGEACVAGENRRRLKATKAVSRQEYYEKMVKVAQDVHDSVICGHVEPDKRQKRRSQGNPRQLKPELVYEQENNDILPSKAQKKEEYPGEVIHKQPGKRSVTVLEKGEHKNESEACHSELVDKHDDPSELNEEEMRGSCERDEGELRVHDPVVRGEHEQKAEEPCDRPRTETRQPEAHKKKMTKESKEVADKRLEETFVDVLMGDRLQKSCDSEEKDNTRYLQQMKAADKRLKDAFEDVSGRERLERVSESQENETRNLQQRDEYENHREQAFDGQESKKPLEKCVVLEKSEINKAASKQEARRQRFNEYPNPIVDYNSSAEGQKQDESKEKLEKTTELKHTSLRGFEMEKIGKINENADDREVQKGEDKSYIKIELEDENQGPHSSPDMKLPTKDKHVKSSDGANLYKMDVELNMSCKLKKSQMKVDGSKDVSSQKGNEEIDSAPSDDKSKLEAVKTADVLIDERQVEATAAQVGPNECELEGRTIPASKTLDLNDKNTSTRTDCIRNEQNLKEASRKVAQSASNPNLVKDPNVDIGGKRNLVGEGQAHIVHKEKARSTVADDINGFNEHASKVEPEGHTVLSEGKDNFQNISDLPNIGQSIERKGKISNHNFTSEEKDEDKKRDLEEERLQKLEEERERLREREKDRMAVELAVREARDRAYADARDRAERAALEKATDEARQRAMTEARERLEKACAEARDRSLADKASSEAKLRAERAAVERANAEARQRAIEKAVAERATLGARERIQRSVSEKYTSERDVIMRQSSFPTSSERFEAANGEPAERCKARLERHRRTVERVAKALAEKNMRDLLAQREQAERTRFAETLDADIRRWSGGKEGNLRALLSTLQYILGPDSGWQPIPLTEVITAAAVKKAYRKATLCVHPDKLQQRGATVQQKYICEKVFDLLKVCFLMLRISLNHLLLRLLFKLAF
uniref:J domain-containing protein n=1 Tax=Chenopodium quinoa TaxID=63459 RepID=A0A803L6V5_CHEQI